MTKTLPHMFMPGETVEGILKKVNRHDVTPPELLDLVSAYIELNGSAVPRPGTRVKIPLLSRHVVDFDGS